MDDSPLRHRIALPEPSRRYDQDAEWFVLHTDDGWREIRFHDYARIFSGSGLYEQLFHDVLECDSPRFMSNFLRTELARADVEPAELRVLDLGAGNGIMGEELTKLGVTLVVGADILPEAARATARDRPGIYRDYYVVDLTALSPARRDDLAGHEFNALSCIAALGFGDIPTECFRNAVRLIEDGGWIVLTIKRHFLDDADTSGFAALLRSAFREGSLELVASTDYRHRLDTSREPLHYTGLVARKQADL